MKTIPFPRPPAWVTIGEGLSAAWAYWRGSWDRWLLAVFAVALADGLATWLIGSTLLDQRTMTQLLTGGSVDPSLLPRLLAGPLAVAIVSLVADWFLYANAVAGLRGSEVTARWALSAGLRVLLALLALSVVFMGLFVVFAMLGPLSALALLGVLPLLVYLSLRLQFWVVGVFDGLGIEASLRQSWEISRGAVLRILGWVLALLGISLLIGFGTGMLTGLLGALPGPAAVAAAVLGTLVQTAFQAFSVIVTAILYESQLHRFRGQATATPYGGYGGDGGYGAYGTPPVAPPPGWGQPGAWPEPPGPAQDPGTPDPDGPPPPPAPPTAPRDPWRG